MKIGSKKNKALMLLMILLVIVCSIVSLNPNTVIANAKDNITNKDELEKARTEVYEDYVKSLSSRKNELKSGKITIGNATMTFYVEVIGNPGSDGYPIYFGLHGGGNPDTKLQKEQYEIMQNYYNCSISSGIYIVPKSLEARYDEHYLPESFLFYDRLIEDAVLFNNGDPNRVYFMGFSSGGDGVYAIAPVYADKLAAVNMSAGYPTVQKIENMYNLPICLQVGENDDAYDRNILVAKYDSWLNALSEKYKGGFEHEVFIHQNGTHNSWADVTNKSQKVVDQKSVSDWLKNAKNIKYISANTDAVKWVSKYTRNPIPTRVVWSTNTNAAMRESKAFYWLDRDGYLDNTTIAASYNKSKNTVTINKCDATKGTLKIYLNNDMVDLFKEVKVVVGDKTYTVKPIISTDIMKATLKARGDINYMFDAEIDITLSENKNSITVEAVSKHDGSYEVKGIDNLIQWNSDDLFLVDSSLMGLTYEELNKKLGGILEKPEKWEYWGNNLSWTSCDVNGHGVIFMFQNKKTVIIYSETTGKIKDSVIKSVSNVFGAKLSNDGIPKTESGGAVYLINMGGTKYYLENNIYDDKDHMVQKYISISYKD